VAIEIRKYMIFGKGCGRVKGEQVREESTVVQRKSFWGELARSWDFRKK
jgi:hypothetical protein